VVTDRLAVGSRTATSVYKSGHTILVMYMLYLIFEGTPVVGYKQFLLLISIFAFLGVQCIFGHFNTGLN
jgi:hypothetical protein